jgi:hypothetical protein
LSTSPHPQSLPTAADGPPPASAVTTRIRAIEGVLSFVDRASARLSSAAAGIRFGNVQKQEQQIRSELRAIRKLAVDPGVDEAALLARLGEVQLQASRLASALAPVRLPKAAPPTEDSTVAPITAQQAAAIRQAITRSMIALASAPLHLRIEFDAGFRDAHPDTLLLGARMHAIHRIALGSLRQVRWIDGGRVQLAFGEGQEATLVEALFDPEGRLQLPDTWRQSPVAKLPGPERYKDPRPAAGQRPRQRRDGGGGGRGDARNAGPQPGIGDPRANGHTGQRPNINPGRRPNTNSGQRANTDPGQRASTAPGQRANTGPRPRASGDPGSGAHANANAGSEARSPPPHPGHGGRRPQHPGTAKGIHGTGHPARQEGRLRSDRGPSADARPLKPRGPLNTTMADKFRAAFAKSAAEPGSAETSAAPDPSRPADADAGGGETGASAPTKSSS